MVTTHYSLGEKLVAVRKGTALEYVQQDHLGGSVGDPSSTRAQVNTRAYMHYRPSRIATGSLGREPKFAGRQEETQPRGLVVADAA